MVIFHTNYNFNLYLDWVYAFSIFYFEKQQRLFKKESLSKGE